MNLFLITFCLFVCAFSARAANVLPFAEHLDIVEGESLFGTNGPLTEARSELVSIQSSKLVWRLSFPAVPGETITGNGELAKMEGGRLIVSFPILTGIQVNNLSLAKDGETAQTFPLTSVLKKVPPGWRLRFQDNDKVTESNAPFVASFRPESVTRLFVDGKPVTEVNEEACPRARFVTFGRPLEKPPQITFVDEQKAAIASGPADSLVLTGPICQAGIFHYRSSATQSAPPAVTIIPKARWEFRTDLGFGRFSFQQPGISFSEGTVSGKVSGRRTFEWLGQNFFGSANLFLTLFPFASSSNLGARVLGANLRVGYAIPWPETPWRLSIAAGFYYTTMYSAGDSFGYRNLIYTQLYPALTRAFGVHDSVSAYFKFAPLSRGIFPFDFSQREIAGGLAWDHDRYSLSLDYSDFQIELGGNRACSHSFVVNVGYRW